MMQVLSDSITVIFLLVVISYYVLFFVKRKPLQKGKVSPSITVIVPAHNEERYLAACIESIVKARFEGDKQIICIDDGSTDSTAKIARRFPVTLLRQKHSGKSVSINKALNRARGELIAIVDADSTIEPEALARAQQMLSDRSLAAVTSVIKVKNRRSLIGMWLHIEQLYNSLLRSLFTKVNVNIVTPGPLSVYRKSSLLGIGGFDTKGFSEDVDVAVRLIKAGHKIEMSEASVAQTNMPIDWKGFSRQRRRFARGWINILKRHIKLNTTLLKIYTLPLALFGYLQAVVMGLFTCYNLAHGYFEYFFSKGVYLSWSVVMFFFDWFSILGIVKWAWRVAIGQDPLTLLTAVGLGAALMTYPLYLIAIFKYDKNFDWMHAIPLVFMFPFWFVIMLFYIGNLPEIFNEHQRNIWHK